MVDDDLGSALKKYQEDQAEEWNNNGNEFYRQGDFQNSIECYKMAISKNSSYADAWNNLGMAYMKSGNIEEAKKCHEQLNVIKNSPKNEDPLSPVPAIIQPATARPASSKPPGTPDSDRWPFWLGLFGGLLGILIGLVEFAFIAFLSLLLKGAEFAVFLLPIATLICSVIGMVCGMAGRTKNVAVLMIICGVIVLLTTYFIGILVTIFFVVGGYLLYENVKD